MPSNCRRIGGFILAFLAAAPFLRAQHAFENTRTVDLKTVGDPPVPVADFADIQQAINAIIPTGGEKWTILIYSGTYSLSEPLALDEDGEDIDLVGVDASAVIIDVSGTDKDGLVITSGTESARNNVIRNLTIKTSNGHGVKIVKGGTPVPKGILIEGVTIVAAGTDKDGILAAEVENLTVRNCTISAGTGNGIELDKPSGEGTVAPTNVTITNCTVVGDGSGKYALDAADADGVVIAGCYVRNTNETGLRGAARADAPAGQTTARNPAGLERVQSHPAAAIKPGRDTRILFSTVMGTSEAVSHSPPGGRVVIQNSVLNDRSVTELILATPPRPVTTPTNSPT
jgi:hypothetical protein